MSSPKLEQLLQAGISAARAGRKDEARELLLRVIAQEEESEAAWLWLSSVVDDPGEKQICLENVLVLNPANSVAQQGLDWLRQQDSRPPPQPHEPPRLVPRPVPQKPPSPPSPPLVEIDPYGCPYCGGSVSGEGDRCDHCRRLVIRRHRKRAADASLIWLVVLFVLLGAASWLEGFSVAQLVQVGSLPAWLSQTAVRYLVGSALFSPEGLPGTLIKFAGLVTAINYGLAVLCGVAAAGLALRIKIVYFGSFLLAAFIAIMSGVGLLTGLTGWLLAVLRLILVVAGIKFLVDNAPAFEWETRHYNADTERGLKNDLDYHNQAQRHYDMGMWAKAAAHWKVAARLAPDQVQYRAELANAHLRMGYLDAALAEADKAVDKAPDDEELRAFRSSLVALAGKELH